MDPTKINNNKEITMNKWRMGLIIIGSILLIFTSIFLTTGTKQEYLGSITKIRIIQPNESTEFSCIARLYKDEKINNNLLYLDTSYKKMCDSLKNGDKIYRNLEHEKWIYKIGN